MSISDTKLLRIYQVITNPYLSTLQGHEHLLFIFLVFILAFAAVPVMFFTLCSVIILLISCSDSYMWQLAHCISTTGILTRK